MNECHCLHKATYQPTVSSLETYLHSATSYHLRVYVLTNKTHTHTQELLASRTHTNVTIDADCITSCTHTHTHAHMYIHPYTSHSLLNPRNRNKQGLSSRVRVKATKAKDFIACRRGEIARSQIESIIRIDSYNFRDLTLTPFQSSAHTQRWYLSSLYLRASDLHLIGSPRPFVFFIFNQNTEPIPQIRNEWWVRYESNRLYGQTPTHAVWSVEKCK